MTTVTRVTECVYIEIMTVVHYSAFYSLHCMVTNLCVKKIKAETESCGEGFKVRCMSALFIGTIVKRLAIYPLLFLLGSHPNIILGILAINFYLVIRVLNQKLY